MSEEEEKEDITLWILCFCMLKAGGTDSYHTALGRPSLGPDLAEPSAGWSLCWEPDMADATIFHFEMIGWLQTLRGQHDSYPAPARPQSGWGHIGSGHKQKADQTMISTTCCYYYVLYASSVDMQLALDHGEKNEIASSSIIVILH
jgi:hypothetical protein